jgi:hypothetical protein
LKGSERQWSDEFALLLNASVEEVMIFLPLRGKGIEFEDPR